MDKRSVGFGPRSWRYSMLVNDGVIEKMFIEPGQSTHEDDGRETGRNRDAAHQGWYVCLTVAFPREGRQAFTRFISGS